MRFVTLGNESIPILISKGLISNAYNDINVKLYVFGGLDDKNNLRAFALFAGVPFNYNSVSLEHIYVKPEYRGRGISISLFEYAKNKLKAAGINRIRCARAINIVKSTQFEIYMQNLGFQPVILDAYELRVGQNGFKNEIMDKVHSVSSKSDKIIKINNYDDPLLKKFLRGREKTGIYLSKDEYIPSLCRFYIQKNKVVAAVCMKKIHNGDLMLVGTYKDIDCDQEYAIAYLFAELTYDKENNFDSEKNIIINVYREIMYESLLKICKDIRSDKLLQEYDLNL